MVQAGVKGVRISLKLPVTPLGSWSPVTDGGTGGIISIPPAFLLQDFVLSTAQKRKPSLLSGPVLADWT